MLQFDVILKELGGFGISQIILSCLLIYYDVPSGINGLATVFIAYSPGVRCNVPLLKKENPNLTESDILNLTTPYDPTTQTYDGCYRYDYDLQACEGDTSCVNKSYPPIKCDNGYHYDRSIFLETVVTEFDMTCGNKYLNTVSTSLYYAGMLLGSLFFGNFADRFGRKTCILVAQTLTLGCMFGLAFSRSVILYIIFRVGIAGFGYGTTIGSFVYLMEIVGKNRRSLVGMGFQFGFSVGVIIMSGIAYEWRNWHDMMLVAALFAIPALIFSFIIPESPRWLFTHNKEKQAINIIKMMARLNKIKLSDEIWQEARKIGEEENAKLVQDKKFSSLDLFRYKGTSIITMMLMWIWFVDSIVYYGVSLNTSALAGDIFINNTLYGAFEILSFAFCVLVMDRFGRRIILSFLFFLTGLCLIASVIVNVYAGTNQAWITLGLILAFLSKLGISGAFAISYNFTCELYPTVIRSNGLGIGSFASRIGGIIAPYFISLQDYHAWLPNVIFGVLAMVTGLMSLTLPETNNHGMMETIEEAEEFYQNPKGNTCARSNFLDGENDNMDKPM